MTVDWIATFLLVPPINLLLLTIGGFALSYQHPRAGRWIMGLGLGGLLILGMPLISGTLLDSLENTKIPPSPDQPPTAIVILGGDVRQIAGLQPQASLGSLTLERVRTGAALYRTTHLPILTTGGIIDKKEHSLAKLMAQALSEDFDVSTKWVESASRTTWENAEFSRAILRAENINSIYLVTHSWHMRRAMIAFTYFGFTVTPAPVPPDKAPSFELTGFLPQASAWLRSYYALHEWIGCGWYGVRAASSESHS